METAAFAWDLPLADDEERGAADFAATLLDAGDFEGVFVALDDVFAFETRALGAAGLGVDALDLTVFAFTEADFFAGPPFFTDAAA